MKRLKHNFKKGMAFVLTLAMVAGLVPAMSGGANTVQAATVTGSTPSVSAYATKTQLMNEFTPGNDGTASHYGKLIFGKNKNNEAQQWYILGKDTGVSGDNTIIFAASPIATGQVFEDNWGDCKTYNTTWGCTYPSDITMDSGKNVGADHYGASDLRAALNDMVKAGNETYFTAAQRELMNATTVTTKDTRNKDSSDNYVTYTTTDKLYALTADGIGSSYTTIKAGTSNSTVLAMSKYWGTQGDSLFWLRSPFGNADYSGVLFAKPGNSVGSCRVDEEVGVRPASNLNLSSVLFASSATAASSDTAVSGTIDKDTNGEPKAMTLRLDGSSKNIGLVTYNTTTGDIKVAKGSTTGDVALVVQGNDGTRDWYYSKKITATETVNASDIKSAISTSAEIDLSACKIWLETTAADGMIYAVNAEKEIEKINTTYVTKEQLMNSFKPYSGGTAANIGKLVFGKNSSGAPQEWYILGKDTGVSGDNTIIFAASPIKTEQVFGDNWADQTYDTTWGCTYPSDITMDSDKYVNPNHYGASDLRVELQSMATNSNYFTPAEQGLMNDTTVRTLDTQNGVTYTTTDKLYALAAEENDSTIKAGSNDSTVLAMSKYWDTQEARTFWLRSPANGDFARDGVLFVQHNSVEFTCFDNGIDVRPASNLNLSSVLFASSATAASSSSPSFGTIADGTAMTLRLDGSSKKIGLVTYSTTTKVIKVAKGSTTGNVALVVQGNDETNDWYYSKQITGTDEVNASAIKEALNLSTEIDLSECKIWLETTAADGMNYAVNAEKEKEIEKINTTYVTKEQLMNSFSPYLDGTATNMGKLVFGKDENGTAQEWYILGKDTGVAGDNTIIFAASPIATGQKFSAGSATYSYEAGTGYGDTAGNIAIYPNHYGASALRVALKGMADGSDTTYFTTAQQGLMNATTVTTKDTLNKDSSDNYVTYTTTDKLYALAADGDGSSYQTIKAGSNEDKVLLRTTYWNTREEFWLRSPYDNRVCNALLALPGSCVDDYDVYDGYGVRPASNLNLSSVLFASSAGAASDAVSADTIASGTAMTLRLDGRNTPIGTVLYDADDGMIVTDKDAGATGTVSLVVQGNDGTNDWYYSKVIDRKTQVSVDDIKGALADKLTLSEDLSLQNCKIWLETTDNNEEMTYARMAEPENIEIINSVEVTGMKPVAGTAFNTTASCGTTGIDTTTPAITYTTKVNGSDVDATGIADWNKTYKAKVTLATDTSGDKIYVFGSSVSVTVDGVALTPVNTPNEDGTLTVTGEFTTDRRKIGSVTAPTVPAGNTFTTYYGYEGNADTPISGSNSELGTQAAVTFEGTVEPTTADMNVTWTIANDGGADYDKTPGAENTFRWTIPASALTNYNAAECQGYDAAAGTITGTVTVKNKAATPVTITGTDSDISYTGTNFDVSQYFTIDTNAGTANYSLIDGAAGGTGTGTLSGSILTVMETGTFRIKVNTAANGIYGPGEETVTLTVKEGAIDNTASGYTGAYDGKSHSIKVTVTSLADTTVTYSTDGTNYSTTNPSFTDKGEYKVYYKIVKNNYTAKSGDETVSIGSRSISITAQDQSIVCGDSLDQTKYTVSENGLADGDRISEITLTPGTTSVTENGTIAVNDVKIVNAAGEDVTGNYQINSVPGTLKITEATAQLNITTTSLDKVYDGVAAANPSVTYTGVNGENIKTENNVTFTYYQKGESGNYHIALTGAPKNAGEYKVVVSAAQVADYNPVNDEELAFSISKRSITITAQNQTIMWNDNIDQSKYTVSENGLAAGDSISEITLTPSTTALTENGIITISNVKITNAAGEDVTGNYNITPENGILKVTHNTGLAPTKIEAVKTRTEYVAGDILNVDDLTVTAYYPGGHSEIVTDFTTNASKIDMSVIGDKTLTVSFTKNGGTVTKDITIKVSHNTTLAPSKIEAVKTRIEYAAGDTLNVDDLTVTAYYSDDYSESVTDYTTNASMLDMSVIGDKTLTVSYTENGETVTKDITIKVSHNTGLVVTKIEAVKTRTAYVAGDKLNVDDLTVTAYYADGHSEKVTNYTTNAAKLNMAVDGDKTLTVSYTKNGKTVTKNILIKVSCKTSPAPTKPVPTKAKESISPDQVKQNSVKLDIYTGAEWKGNKFVVTWDKINDADGYDIFATRCGKTMTSKSLVKTVKGQKSSATLSKIAGNKLSGKMSYKVKIKAYKMVNGKKKYIGTSSTYHVAGKSSKEYTNAKKIKVSKKSVSLKKGKTSQIKATIVKQSSKKKLLGKGHGPSLRYISTDTSVATVTSKGKIKAKKKGNCYIYIKALNGVTTRVKVTVKGY